MRDSPSSSEVDWQRLLDAVKAEIAAEHGVLSWLRERRSTVRTAIALAVAALVVALEAMLARAGAAPAELGRGARPWELIASACLLATLASLALRPMQRLESVRLERVLAALGLVAPALLALFPLHDSHEIPGEPGYCLVLGASAAALLLVVFRTLDRGDHRSRRRALLAVGAAAFAANVGLEFHCPITRAEHKLLFHASVALLLVALYGLVVLRAERVRWARANTSRPTAHLGQRRT